ncbi:glycosyltransferase family 1 protein [Fulvivirga sp. M361]|uniref:glycosyltransferase n=1 Tax=Fulvivirga sp. M361 TaxID=2594266 RepID=UPI001179962A|nr:glycosyltransferase [Fulvivirga sp. M361]TRX60122.1 glycosyltransferase family 1 protein [Fulvivirga sp. M361]
MVSGRDVVFIGIQPWDIKIGSNCKNIALELSKNNRVLYVNAPLDRKTAFIERHSEGVKKRKSIIKGEAPDLEKINSNLHTFYPKKMIESINWLPHGSIYRLLNKRNAKLFFNEVKRVLKDLSFENYVLFNDCSMFLGYHATEMLDPSLSLYYIRDNLVSQYYFGKHGKTMEPELAAKYDVVMANSNFLSEYLGKYNPHSYMVGQGCDLDAFKPDNVSKDAPLDLKPIPRPIIGYLGYLTTLRLSIELIVELAKSRPDYSFVLVGPEDTAFKDSELHNMANVHFLGSKESNVLSDYIGHFDVAINPQTVNGMTIGNYPRKIDEYLALGKPTVATATPAMQYFEDTVYLAEDAEDYASKIDLALDEDNKELAVKRIKCAEGHTWGNHVENMGKVIEKIMKEKGKAI